MALAGGLTPVVFRDVCAALPANLESGGEMSVFGSVLPWPPLVTQISPWRDRWIAEWGLSMTVHELRLPSRLNPPPGSDW